MMNKFTLLLASSLFSKKWFVFRLVLFLTTASQTANAQWVRTSGPEGGYINTVERVGDEIWAGSDNGVYVSRNEGASWELSQSLWPMECICIKSFHDTIIILYTPYIGYMVPYETRTSFDGGLTWRGPVPMPESFNLSNVNSIKKVKNTLFIYGSRTFTSTNFGLSWQEVSIPGYGHVEMIASDDKGILVFAATSNWTSSANFYFGEGQAWTFVDSSYHTRNAILKDSTIIYSVYTYLDSTYTRRFARSTNLGRSWDTVYTAFGVKYNHEEFTKAGNYFYYLNQDNDEVLKSADQGASWTVETGSTELINDELKINTGEYLLAHAGGMCRLNPFSGVVYPTNTGLRATSCNSLVSHDDVLYTNTFRYTFKSVDGGAMWDSVNAAIGKSYSFLFKDDSVFCFVSGDSISLARSFDRGISWDLVKLPFYPYDNHTDFSLALLNGTLYTSVYDSIKYSQDLGLTWSVTNRWGDFYGSHQNIIKSGYLKTVNRTLYAITDDGFTLKYNQITDTWNFIQHFHSPGLYSGNKIYDLDGILVTSGNYAFTYSLDSGATWISPSNIGLSFQSNGWGHPKNFVSYDGVWFATSFNNIYYSNDRGEHWQLVQNPQPFNLMGDLAIVNNVLFAGSKAKGIWRRSGPISTIKGKVYRDFNNNGVADGEDVVLPGVSLYTSPLAFYSTTNELGNYTMFTDGIGDSLKLILPSSICSSTPSGYIVNGSAENRDFALYVVPGVKDLSVDLSNVNVFRPGYETILNLTVTNHGSVDQSSDVTLVLDSTLNFINSTPSPFSINGDTISWHTESLTFMESKNIAVNVLSDWWVTIGDSVKCSASVVPVGQDSFPVDNYTELSSVYVGSYDPNDKTCQQGGYITPEQVAGGEELVFTIRFQNTGTYLATNVHISDTLSNYLDLKTFRVISASHQQRTTLSGSGIADFHFDQINLPDSNQNKLLSHGYVKYGVKCKSNVAVGNAITNKAYIYFDFNSPVLTNTTTTLVAYPVILSEGEPSAEVSTNAILVYPNPAKDIITINTRGINESKLVLVLLDAKGSLLRRMVINGKEYQFATGDLPGGVYFGIILNQSNQRVAYFKFIHQ